jgi:hypothetical protein
VANRGNSTISQIQKATGENPSALDFAFIFEPFSVSAVEVGSIDQPEERADETK